MIKALKLIVLFTGIVLCTSGCTDQVKTSSVNGEPCVEQKIMSFNHQKAIEQNHKTIEADAYVHFDFNEDTVMFYENEALIDVFTIDKCNQIEGGYELFCSNDNQDTITLLAYDNSVIIQSRFDSKNHPMLEIIYSNIEIK